MRTKGTLWWIVGAVLFSTCLTVGIWLTVRPIGELVGEARIGEDVEVDAQAGDTLHFRLSYALSRAPFSSSGSQNTRAIHAALRESILQVTAVDATGLALRATCPAYDGKATSSFGTPAELEISYANLICTIPVQRAGHYKLRGDVQWAPQLRPRFANLEVRRAGGT